MRLATSRPRRGPITSTTRIETSPACKLINVACSGAYAPSIIGSGTPKRMTTSARFGQSSFWSGPMVYYQAGGSPALERIPSWHCHSGRCTGYR